MSIRKMSVKLQDDYLKIKEDTTYYIQYGRNRSQQDLYFEV